MPNQIPSVDSEAFGLNASTAFAEPQSKAIALNLAPPSDELCARLLSAVQHAASPTARSMEALRATVEEFTVTLQNGGATPEAVLIALKSVINNRTLFLDTREPHLSGDPLREKISKWSIEAFFREKTA